jgi:hypothetical protein
VTDQGYQDMPQAAYKRWLKTIEKEKKKQENQALQSQMKFEIEMLKKLQQKIILKPNK